MVASCTAPTVATSTRKEIPMKERRVIATITAVLAVASAAHLATSTGHAQARHRWAQAITNPYLPMTPGSVWVYTGMKDGVTQTDVVRATHKTKRIVGVRTTVVRDVSRHGGHTLEATADYYAQDAAGNVWYFGERTKAYGPGGQVDTSGSWQAGRNGARPGIVMAAHPAVDDAHRQEYARGKAEDQYWLVDLHHRVSVPFVSSDQAALTIEWSRLEPNVIDEKAYIRGIGPVREVAVQGSTEFANLVRFHKRAG
jgi:hypothetical protein